MFIFPGRRTAQSSVIVSTALPACRRLSRKKSPEFSARSGCSPRFIMCALRIILLSPVWRNISVRRTVATTWLRMSAENTLPGPTDGS